MLVGPEINQKPLKPPKKYLKYSSDIVNHFKYFRGHKPKNNRFRSCLSKEVINFFVTAIL